MTYDKVRIHASFRERDLLQHNIVIYRFAQGLPIHLTAIKFRFLTLAVTTQSSQFYSLRFMPRLSTAFFLPPTSPFWPLLLYVAWLDPARLGLRLTVSGRDFEHTYDANKSGKNSSTQATARSIKVKLSQQYYHSAALGPRYVLILLTVCCSK